MGLIEISGNLHSSGITDHPRLFSIYLKAFIYIYGAPNPGYYNFSNSMIYFSAVKKILTGDTAKLTIPEGSTQKQIAHLIEKKTGGGCCPAYISTLKEKKIDYEGKLFPATYNLSTDNPEELIRKMLDTFKNRVQKLNLSRDDLILASMIQMEGAKTSEFKRISGVFKNRLKLGMKLESDPTLQYIVGRVRLTKEILMNTSGYNTYMHKGLPPGPICNPGMDAIKAAIEPEEHDYLYFVARGDGTHYFSKYKAEHFRAVKHFMLKQPTGWTPPEQ